MCLSKICEQFGSPDNVIYYGFKKFTIDPYCNIEWWLKPNGSSIVPLNTWIKAKINEDIMTLHGTYKSGFHIYEKDKDCSRPYFSRNHGGLICVPVRFRGITCIGYDCLSDYGVTYIANELYVDSKDVYRAMTELGV